jgi:hypothetical protein
LAYSTLAHLQHEQECCACALQAEEQRKQAAATRAKAIADEADERHRQDALAVEQRLQELAERASATAENALATGQRCQELAERAVVTAENALAVEQRRQESAERAAAMVENALAAEQCHQELAECAAETAEKVLAMEQCHQELAEHAAATAEKALAEEQRLSLLAKMALAEYNAQTIASWDATAVEAVDHITALGVMMLTKLKAAPKLRYGGPPPTHFSPPLTAKEVAKLDAATLDKQRRHETAAREKALSEKANKQRWVAMQEKALADKAYEQRQAAMQEKVLADEVNKQCCQVTAARENALADDAFE